MSKLPQLPKGILREKKVTCKPMSTPAIKHTDVLNMAIGILKVRKFNDVVAKAVTITKNKKQLNRMRKILAKVDKEIDAIINTLDRVFDNINYYDLMRIKQSHSAKTIALIPEKSTNPEILGLYLLYLEFQDAPDAKMDERLRFLQEIDYMSLIITISEEIGLTKDVIDDMYELALRMIEDIQ